MSLPPDNDRGRPGQGAPADQFATQLTDENNSTASVLTVDGSYVAVLEAEGGPGGDLDG